MNYDVIVIGAGGSGLAAAVSAAGRGGRVLVLEKQRQPGGTTGIAVGSYTAAGTRWQREADIEDSPQAHAEDAAKFAAPEIESRNNDAMRAWFLQRASETLDWLTELGLSFVGPSPEPPNRAPRMHNVVPGAKAYVAALQIALLEAGGKLLCNADAQELLMQDGRVAGVRASVAGHTQEFTCERGVILAAGDYASNADMIAQYKGEQFRLIDGINPYAHGDGHRLAQAVRAELVNMDVTYGPELRFVPSRRRPFQQWLPTSPRLAAVLAAVSRKLPRWVMRRLIKRLLVTWQHPEDALFDDGAILLNREGRRFVNERMTPEREMAIAVQPRKEAFILLDGALVKRYSSWPHFISTAPDIAYAYVPDYQRLRPDVTVTGISLTGVAARRGMSSETVAETLRQYNAYALGNRADSFGRTGDTQPMESGPWVILGPVKPYFTTTEGGVRVNERLQAIDTNGDVIPGLYAVGQNGLSGMILWGHGLHIAWAITSGRLAGEFVMQGNER